MSPSLEPLSLADEPLLLYGAPVTGLSAAEQQAFKRVQAALEEHVVSLVASIFIDEGLTPHEAGPDLHKHARSLPPAPDSALHTRVLVFTRMLPQMAQSDLYARHGTAFELPPHPSSNRAARAAVLRKVFGTNMPAVTAQAVLHHLKRNGVIEAAGRIAATCESYLHLTPNLPPPVKLNARSFARSAARFLALLVNLTCASSVSPPLPLSPELHAHLVEAAPLDACVRTVEQRGFLPADDVWLFWVVMCDSALSRVPLTECAALAACMPLSALQV